jgi:hypothetical protein
MSRPPFPFASLAPAASAALAVLAVIGCGDGRLPRSPVSGSVRVDGKPAAGAVVVLHPVAGSVASGAERIRPTGTCDRDGKFVLGTWELADGVPAGRWKATVQWFAADGAAADADPETVHGEHDRLGGAYGDPEATPLMIDVAKSAIELPPFELQVATPR